MGFTDQTFEKIEPSSLRVRGNRLIIRRDNKTGVTPGGIILHDMSEKVAATGTVLDIGPEVKESLQVGDRVIFNRGCTRQRFSDVENGDTILIMEMEHVYGVLGKDVDIEG